MRALILGAKGQLGRALSATAAPDAQIISHGIETLDITDETSVRAVIADAEPDIILNAAAYTAVDKAEGDEAAAHAVNATAVGLLAAVARDSGARFVHVSSDFVFDGSAGVPYAPDAEPNPLNVYGRTKLAGELLAGDGALIVRTAWVYAPTGHNFVRTMLRLMREQPEVRVVADQIGTPTCALGVAAALWKLGRLGATGIYHYTDSGVASWYDFAVAIQEEALELGLLDGAVPVHPIATEDVPAPARRPSFSVMNTKTTCAVLGERPPHWRSNLRVQLREIRKHG